MKVPALERVPYKAQSRYDGVTAEDMRMCGRELAEWERSRGATPEQVQQMYKTYEELARLVEERGPQILDRIDRFIERVNQPNN
jgi:hypothetical protein